MGQTDQETKVMKSQADSTVWNGTTYLPLGDGVDWAQVAQGRGAVHRAGHLLTR